MDNSVIKFISKYILLSDKEAEIISQQNSFKFYKKNELLLSEGNLAKECFFILNGCIRAYYLKDGNEINTDFYFENQTIRPVSYLTKRPSEYFLSCLEDSFIAIGNAERNETLLKKIPKLSSLVMQLNDDLIIQKTFELDYFKKNNPEERYLNLLNTKPELINRIPLYHLASYLGITQVSLSRIRARILSK